MKRSRQFTAVRIAARAVIAAVGLIVVVVAIFHYIWPVRVSPFLLERSRIEWKAIPSPTLQEANSAVLRRSLADSLNVLERHGWQVSAGAYEGLPPEVLAADVGRLADAVLRVGGRFHAARDNYTLEHPAGPRAGWRRTDGKSVADPDGFVPWRSAGDGPVPVKLVPNPDAIRRTFAWPGRGPVPVDLTAPFAELSKTSRTVGRMLLFTPGLNSRSGFIVDTRSPPSGGSTLGDFCCELLVTSIGPSWPGAATCTLSKSRNRFVWAPRRADNWRPG